MELAIANEHFPPSFQQRQTERSSSGSPVAARFDNVGQLRDTRQQPAQRIQAGDPITRGTLQTVFRYTPFDELERLGLLPDTETEARRSEPSVTGMLVVSEVQPGSAG